MQQLKKESTIISIGEKDFVILHDLVLKTRKPKDTDLEHFIHGMIGMKSEIGELLTLIKRDYVIEKEVSELEIKEEIGDFLWFYMLVCLTTATNNKMDKDKIYDAFKDIGRIFHHSKQDCIADLLMSEAIIVNMFLNEQYKELRIARPHSKKTPPKPPHNQKVVMEHLILQFLTCCDYFGVTDMDEIIKMNYKKLMTRYPDNKFTMEHAINRDKAKEYKAMEANSEEE